MVTRKVNKVSNELTIDPEDVQSFDCVVGSEEKPIIKMWTAEWDELVKSHLGDNDCWDGRPKAFALRRVIETLVGPVVRSELQVIRSEDFRAAVVYNMSVLVNGLVRSYCGSSEVNDKNTDDLYLAFALPTAETIAMGRACKSVLGYKGLTAEEIPNNKDTARLVMEELRAKPTDGSYNEKAQITDLQKKTLVKLCQNLGIDHDAVAKLSKKQKLTKLADASKETATFMLGVLNEWANDPTLVPTELKSDSKT